MLYRAGDQALAVRDFVVQGLNRLKGEPALAARREQDAKRRIGKKPDEALAGADYVREQLLSALNMGPNSLHKKAYAIECRVKTIERFIEKIERKRRGKKLNYTGFDATDIVRLNIISRFDGHLPEILRKLISFLEFCQTPYFNLLPPGSLSEVIHEAIVYYISEQEVMYRNAYDLLRSLSLGKGSDGREKLVLKPATTLNPYSSIHIVIYMNAYYGSSIRRVPVEIQVRTAVEDKWSKIDHSIRYKWPDFEKIYASNSALLAIAQNISLAVGAETEEARGAALWNGAVESLGRSARVLAELAESTGEAIARIAARGDRIDRIQKDTRALLNALVAPEADA